MIGKFFLAAFLFVSLAQVQGNELENAIANGLKKVNILYENGQRKINSTIQDVDYKTIMIQSKTLEFIIRSEDVQEGAARAMRNVAQAMEEKAKEMGKPESVLECIRRNEENANNQIKIFTQKFKVDIERLESVKLANIETDTKPLDEMQDSLTVRYDRAVKIIQNCQTPSCVNIAVRSCGKWLEQMYANIRRIVGQVLTIVGNYNRDGSNYFNNSNRQIVRIRSSTIRNIRRCLFSRRDTEDEY